MQARIGPITLGKRKGLAGRPGNLKMEMTSLIHRKCNSICAAGLSGISRSSSQSSSTEH